MPDPRRSIGRPTRGDLGLLVAALVGGALLFSSLDTISPLAEIDLFHQGRGYEALARDRLEALGFDMTGFEGRTDLVHEMQALEYVDRNFERAQAQAWIRDGTGLYVHRVQFKRAGDATLYAVFLHPEHGLRGWRCDLQDDVAGPRLTADQARQRMLDVVPAALALAVDGWDEMASSTVERVDRTDHWFTFERLVSDRPELRLRLYTQVAGDRVVRALTRLEPPPAAERQLRAAEAPERALQVFGYLALATAGIAGLFVFLRRLRDGQVRLLRAALWPAVALGLLLLAQLVQTAMLFAAWDPLWPRWISTIDTLVWSVGAQVGMIIGLFVLIGAADAIDRTEGMHRGRSLWTLVRGGLGDAEVGLASLRGFLIGLICGGALTAALLLLDATVGAGFGLQPRGFFFYAINTASPTVSTLAYFLFVALAEEMGYRFFGATWLMARTGRRWLAIGLPAVIYGLTHTGLDFLPPFEPFWGRAFALTAVGLVWGWAFLRFDALTVVLSHYTADLFIFNWPRLASSDPGTLVPAIVTVTVPLLPALLWLVSRATRTRLTR